MFNGLAQNSDPTGLIHRSPSPVLGIHLNPFSYHLTLQKQLYALASHLAAPCRPYFVPGLTKLQVPAKCFMYNKLVKTPDRCTCFIAALSLDPCSYGLVPCS